MSSQLWFHPIPNYHDVNKLEPILPQIALTKWTSTLFQWNNLKKRKSFLIFYPSCTVPEMLYFPISKTVSERWAHVELTENCTLSKGWGKLHRIWWVLMNNEQTQSASKVQKDNEHSKWYVNVRWKIYSESLGSYSYIVCCL